MTYVLSISLFALTFLTKCVNSQDQTNITCDRRELKDATHDEIKLLNTYEVLMSLHEKIFLWRQFQTHKVYFEYGSGGSTILACNSPMNKIYTMDSDRNFLLNMFNSIDCLKTNLNQGRVTGIYVDIGETVAWGHPVDLSDNKNFHRYSEQILKVNDTRIDLVLIDGRFRVASALYSLLAISGTGHILIHDFFQRPEYYKILEYVDIVDCVDTMIMVKKKYDIDWTNVLKDILFYVNKSA